MMVDDVTDGWNLIAQDALEVMAVWSGHPQSAVACDARPRSSLTACLLQQYATALSPSAVACDVQTADVDLLYPAASSAIYDQQQIH